MKSAYPLFIGTYTGETKSKGTLLYVSNRGNDSIAVFGIDKSGLLKRTGIFSCGGKIPLLIRTRMDRTGRLPCKSVVSRINYII